MDIRLPISVVSQIDIARLLREMNGLEDFFVGTKARKAGTPMQLPKLSGLLDVVAKENQANLLDENARHQLVGQLNQVLAQAPLLHISFAAEPSPKAVERILSWMRSNIHPQALLQVGIQPTIAAGCVLRTENKFFDMSMRNHLKKQEPFMVQLIQGAVSGRH